MCTNCPSLNKATDGEEGGKGIIISLALEVDSVSTPAKTVVKLLGVLSNCKDAITPGLAVPAAQPQTEFTMTKVVPSFFIILSTSSTVFNS